MESATAPEYYQSAAFCSAGAEKRQFSSDNKAGEHFVVEEFLDFSNDEDNAAAADAAALDAPAGYGAAGGHSADSVVDSSCNSSSFSGCDPNFVADIGCRSFAHGQFSSDLCVPYDDIAEMEWLSNIVEESFSSEDLQRLQLISGIKARSAETTTTTANAATNHLDESSETAPNNYIINTLQLGRDHDHHDHHVVMGSVPAKARSKRSRAPPCNWTSRLLLLSSSSSSSTASSSPEASEASAPPPTPMLINPMMAAAAGKKGAKKKDAAAAEAAAAGEGGGGVAGAGEGRKCMHCATDKTPQWRTGPMGPKTLCNACGVRYKSGRLVPEYRPAASPTFVLTKHSNSHRKVLELRRQKDMVRAQHHHQFIPNHHQQQDINGGAVAFDRHYHHHHHHHHAPSSSNGGEEYLIHHNVGPDFSQMI